MPADASPRAGGFLSGSGGGAPSWAAMSHDLRTPFNQILGYCDLVRQDARSDDSIGILRAVDEIEGEARSVLGRVVEFFAEPHANDLAADRETLQRDLLEFVTLTLSILQRATGHAHLHRGLSFFPDIERIETATKQLRALSEQLATGPLGISGQSISAATAPTLAQSTERPQPSQGQFVSTDLGGRVLVVDDNEANRALMSRYLERESLDFSMADSGEQALEMLTSESFDLVLLDMRMPGMGGYEALRKIKADMSLRNIPVIVVSALDQIESVAACIELGAADYLVRPFNQVLMRARLKVLLAHKRLADQERHKTAELERALAEIEAQKKVSEQLLLNILPKKIALELQTQGFVNPMYFEDATILIADFVGFTLASETLSVEELVQVLDGYFTAFDRIVDRYGLEKLKTVGDSYIVLSGIPEHSSSHPVDAVLAALEIIETVQQMSGKPVDWKVRIGIHTGPAIAGVVGIRKFAFDVWGDSVNFCSRIEAKGEPNRINISEKTFIRVKDFFACEYRGKLLTKDNREVDMYFVPGVAPSLQNSDTQLPSPSFHRRYRTYFQKDPMSFPKGAASATDIRG
jgi:adenylate cyclase